MMRMILVLTLGLLAGCGPRGPDRDIKIGVRECEDLGYERGNADFVSCVQKIVLQERAERDAELKQHLRRR